MNEYIIVNKTLIQKRIEELKKEEISEFSPGRRLWVDSAIKNLKEILSQSTPLIPEIEKSMDSLRPYIAFDDLYEAKKDYISNLKLDI